MPDTTQETVPFLSRQEVERRASEYLKHHNLTTIPVNPLRIAHLEGISVNNARFTKDGMAGMITKRGEEVSILVNRDHPPLRKRFTIAHELGHFFLHMTSDGQFVDKEANLFRRQPSEDGSTTPERRREIQANLFAASLLMPEEEVRRYWKERPLIEEMAQIFQVSEEAMGYRVDALGLD